MPKKAFLPVERLLQSQASPTKKIFAQFFYSLRKVLAGGVLRIIQMSFFLQPCCVHQLAGISGKPF
jgi:hypothetical protein